MEIIIKDLIIVKMQDIVLILREASKYFYKKMSENANKNPHDIDYFYHLKIMQIEEISDKLNSYYFCDRVDYLGLLEQIRVSPEYMNELVCLLIKDKEEAIEMAIRDISILKDLKLY